MMYFSRLLTNQTKKKRTRKVKEIFVDRAKGISSWNVYKIINKENWFRMLLERK